MMHGQSALVEDPQHIKKASEEARRSNKMNEAYLFTGIDDLPDTIVYMMSTR